MNYSLDSLRKIYDRTAGRCHLCGKKLSLSNYGSFEKKGSWEIEHSVPRCKGGTNHANNLFPACISCNRSKGVLTSRSARSKYSRTRAPLSKSRKEEVRMQNGLGAAIICGLIGATTGGLGAILGGLIGLCCGYEMDPEQG